MTATIHMVCGGSGAGKTTYAIQFAERNRAIRFSIDPLMQALFAADMKSLDLEWIMDRVERCERLVWDVVPQLLRVGIDTVLDLGFMSYEHRERHRAKAVSNGARISLHFLDVPLNVRRARIAERNRERDPAVFSFEVTEQMFEYMEPRFEPPTASELEGAVRDFALNSEELKYK